MVMKESVENQQPIESQKQGKLSTGTGGKLRLNLAEKNLKLFWSALKVYLHQLRYVCKKSLVLQTRYWQSTLIQSLITPILLVLILFALQQAVYNLVSTTDTRPPANQLKGINKCKPAYRSKLPCITAMYTKPAGNQQIDQIMAAFVSQNNVRKGGEQFSIETSWTPSVTTLPSGNLGVVEVPSDDFIYDFAVANPNVTQWAVSFSTAPADYDPQITLYQYQLWYNYTEVSRPYRVKGAPPFVASAVEPLNDDIVSMMRALDEAIVTVLSSADPNTNFYDIYLKEYPEIPEGSAFNCPRNPDGTVRSIGPFFLFVPMAVIFFNSVSTIVNEKEKGLKEAMQMVGMKPSVFWIGHFLTIGWMVIVNALATVVTGYLLNMSIFRLTEFGLLFFTFLMYGFASLSFGLFLSGLISRVKAAIGAAFFFVIIGVIYIGLGSLATYVWYSDYNDPTATDFTPGWKTLMFFPFFNFNKLIQDIMSYTLKQPQISGTTCSIVSGFSFNWTTLEQRLRASNATFGIQKPELVPYPSESLWLLFMNILLWFLLAYYFDRVMPNENGHADHPLFFLLPKRYLSPTEDKHARILLDPAKEDGDVAAERALVQQYETGQVDASSIGLQISGLHKVYYTFTQNVARLFGYREKVGEASAAAAQARRVALYELSLAVQKGELLALLGSNGAGKTSTMKILYGSSTPTAGNAWIFGNSIRNQMAEIREILGVCPQFDILFPDLTAREHVELFGGIKGLTSHELSRVSEERLKHMRLWNVRDQRTGQYSGGMKRRLSVIISTLGDPKCLFLDEPTTGMDPSNRRFVWSFLEQFKKDRVIVLTTHSMEEADILGDKIAIMSRGRLRAVGKSIRLKNKFGSGYRISMIVPRGSQVPTVKSMISQECPEAVLDEEEFYGGGGGDGTAEKDVNKIAAADSEKTAASESKKIDDGQTARLVYAASSINVVKKLVVFLERITSDKENVGDGGSPLISSFGMSQTTLEDVFMRMVKEKSD